MTEDWKDWWHKDKTQIEEALKRLNYAIDSLAEPKNPPLSGVLGKSRVWLLFFTPKNGYPQNLIAKVDLPERAVKEWKAIEQIRNAPLRIEAMLPHPRNTQDDKVVIYPNVSDLVETGRIWTLTELLINQLEHETGNNCCTALTKTVDALKSFYRFEPGAAQLVSLGGYTWNSAFPDLSDKMQGYTLDSSWVTACFRPLKNPLECFDKTIREAHGRILQSRIHGDLNLTNIIVGLKGDYSPDRVFLIDLAESRSDVPTALDFARLECEFWHEVFAEYGKQLAIDDMKWLNNYITLRDYLDRGDGDVANLPIFSLKALLWVHTLRKEASTVLRNSVPESEYRMAEYMTAIYLTELRSLHYSSVGNVKIKQQITWLGASISYEYLNKLHSGRNPRIPFLTNETVKSVEDFIKKKSS